MELLNRDNLKKEMLERRNKLISEKIDVTSFMVWFVENYPKSIDIVKRKPDYQKQFK